MAKLHAVDLLPHKRLVNALMLGKSTQAELNAFLKEHGFPTITTDHFNVIFGRISRAFPEHFKTSDKSDPDAIDKSGARDMYAYLFDKRYFTHESAPVNCFEDAFKAYQTPQIRRSLKAMAFAQINEEEIELYSNAKYGDGYDTEVYMIFFKYFFDPFEWTYQTRREYMENELNRDLKRLFTLGLTRDPDFIVWKLGLAPTKSFADMLETVTRDCFYHLEEQRDTNPEAAIKWGNLMLKAIDKIKEVEPDDHKATFGDDFRIQLKTVNTAEIIKTKDEIEVEIPDLKEMTGNVVGSAPSLEDLQKAMDKNDK